MLPSILVLLFFGTLLSAQVSTPQAGFVRYDDGTVHAVQGIAASFVFGKPVAASVDAASFSDKGGIVSANGVVLVLRSDGSEIAEYETGESHPVLSIAESLSIAAAWLPSRQSILRWDGAAFTSTVLTSVFSGRVTSLRVVDHTAELLVLNDNTVSAVAVSLDSGDELWDRLLPGVAGPAIQFKSYIVYRDEGGLEVASEDGTRRTIPLPATDLTIERMASDWLHLESRRTNRHWALHVASTELKLSELPGHLASSMAGGEK